jgi:putative membrane protein
MKLLLRWFINALAIFLIPFIIPGIVVANFYTALIAAVVIGLLNAVIRPVLFILSLPITILTLGLFTLVLNALLFWFASTIVKGFEIHGFAAAFLGALAFWLISWCCSVLFGVKKN